MPAGVSARVASGRCVDAAGAPMASVRVHWQDDPDGLAGTSSDADGRFALAAGARGSTAAPAMLVLEKDGFAPLSVEVDFALGATQDLGKLPLE